MMYYKIIMGSNRVYTTTDKYIEKLLYHTECQFIDCTTTDGRKVIINKANILSVEVSENEIHELSEIEQIVGATLNGLFGKPRQIEDSDIGEKVDE